MKSAKEWMADWPQIHWQEWEERDAPDFIRAIQADARESLLEELWAAHYLTSESFKLLRDDEARKLKDTVGWEKEPGT